MDKCTNCGYGHNPETQTCEQVRQQVHVLQAGIMLSKSGYAGINKQGTIVDRRQFPDAVPIQKNELFGVPEPKKIN